MKPSNLKVGKVYWDAYEEQMCRYEGVYNDISPKIFGVTQLFSDGSEYVFTVFADQVNAYNMVDEEHVEDWIEEISNQSNI